MHNVIFQDFIHSTRGVLCIVLVATLMLGACCMVTGRLMAPPHAAATTVDVTVVAEVSTAEEQALVPWGNEGPRAVVARVDAGGVRPRRHAHLVARPVGHPLQEAAASRLLVGMGSYRSAG